MVKAHRKVVIAVASSHHFAGALVAVQEQPAGGLHAEVFRCWCPRSVAGKRRLRGERARQ